MEGITARPVFGAGRALLARRTIPFFLETIGVFVTLLESSSSSLVVVSFLERSN
jgi:hypothetical protein